MPRPDADGVEEDDPFAGLTLDEEFIRGASTFEPPARTRAALGKFGPNPPLPRSWSPAERSTTSQPTSSQRPPVEQPRRRPWPAIITVVTVLVIAGGFGAVQLTGSRSGSHPTKHATRAVAKPTHPSSAAATPANSRHELESTVWVPGQCYTWKQGVDYTQPTEVPCGQPHLFEAVRQVSVANRYPPQAPFPTEPQWSTLDRQVCGPAATAFLHYPLDPAGRFAPLIIGPLADSWARGSRNVECGLGAAGRSTTARDTGTWIVFSGKVEGASQDNLFAAGTCLAMTPTQILGQTACANPHQAEVTGFATAPASVTSPGSPAFTDTAQASCAAVAGKFLGRPFRTSSGMRIGWTLISSIGWQVGERTFNCTIEFSTIAGQFLAHTGALARA